MPAGHLVAGAHGEQIRLGNQIGMRPKCSRSSESPTSVKSCRPIARRAWSPIMSPRPKAAAPKSSSQPRRCCSPRGRRRRAYRAAGPRRPDRKSIPARTGFLLRYRANAGWCPGGYAGDRKARRHQRRAFGGRHSGELAPRVAQKAETLSRRAGRQNRGHHAGIAMDLCVLASTVCRLLACGSHRRTSDTTLILRAKVPVRHTLRFRPGWAKSIPASKQTIR